MGRSCPRPGKAATRHDRQRVAAVRGGPPHVIDGARRSRDQLAEPRYGRLTRRPPPFPVELALDEGLGPDRSQRCWARRTDPGPDEALLQMDGQAEGANGDDHGVARADLREL